MRRHAGSRQNRSAFPDQVRARSRRTLRTTGGIAARGFLEATLVPEDLRLEYTQICWVSATPPPDLLATIMGGKASLFGPLLGGFSLRPCCESAALREFDAAPANAIFAVILLVVRLMPGGIGLAKLPGFRHQHQGNKQVRPAYAARAPEARPATATEAPMYSRCAACAKPSPASRPPTMSLSPYGLASWSV